MTEVMDNTVEATQTESVQDDAVQAQEPNALEEFMADTEQTEETKADSEPKDEPAQTEPEEEPLPKGLRGRIQAAEKKADRSGYERGRQEAESQYQARIADYEAKLAKYADMEITLEAQELSRKEHISLDLAKRLIRAEKGVAPQPQPEAKQTPPAATGKMNNDLLKAQYENIKSNYDIDMLEKGVLTEDELEAITNGKMDFNAVLLKMLSDQVKQLKAKPDTPPPVKSGTKKQQPVYDFMSMTDEEFDRFNAKIGSGHPFKPR